MPEEGDAELLSGTMRSLGNNGADFSLKYIAQRACIYLTTKNSKPVGPHVTQAAPGAGHSPHLRWKNNCKSPHSALQSSPKLLFLIQLDPVPPNRRPEFPN